jgi:putative NIF3 family GTP cyclohydrolase 1 type 2
VPDADYGHRVILELDDWGTADKGFLSYWHYLEPNEQTIRQDLIEPLEEHHGVASAMVDTGYVNRESQRIVSPWTRKFTDSYGLHQDYDSTRKGLEAAVAAGVLNIESHGWTHMEPNLESSPGPWWTADLAGEGSVDGWYSEFQDRLRDRDVPATAQLYHMKRSLAEIQQDFGVDPMELKPGGDAWSRSQFNNTAALSARVGFGLFHGDTSTYYLDHELVLDMANVVPHADTGYDILAALHPEQWPYHPDGPVILGFHDRDISLDHNFIEQLFAALPRGYETIGTNQYVAILHTQVTSSADEDLWQLTFEQDPHYCAYFRSHPSSWQLWLSDPLRDQLASSRLRLSIDNQPVKIGAEDFSAQPLTIHLPSGTGTHTWKLETTKGSEQH